MEHPFRSAAIGGFHKQDVLDYLEVSAQENGKKLRELSDRLDKTQAERERLAASQEEQSAKTQSLDAENRALKARIAQLEPLQAQLRDSQLSAQKAAQRVKQLEQERAALIQELERLRKENQESSRAREQSAGMELDARRKAHHTLALAQSQANRLRHEGEQWLSQLEQEYGQLRSEMDATAFHAARDLERVGALLAQVTQRLEQQDAALTKLKENCLPARESKVPAPMPIPEEEISDK